MDAKAYEIIADAHKRALKRKKQRENAIKRAAKPKQEKPALTICAMPDCNNPRAVFPSGYVHVYCSECNAKKKQEYKQRALAKVASAKVPMCNNCYKKPCFVDEDGKVFKRCAKCKDYYKNQYQIRSQKQLPLFASE